MEKQNTHPMKQVCLEGLLMEFSKEPMGVGRAHEGMNQPNICQAQRVQNHFTNDKDWRRKDIFEVQ